MDGSLKNITFSGKGGSYEIIIGRNALHQLKDKLRSLSADIAAIVINTRIKELYGDYIDGTVNLDIPRISYVMPDGEEHKNYLEAEKLFAFLLENGLTRRSLVIGIGGGVTGDFAGYAAALFMRGLPIVQVPTSLLAMVDSSIGGKVAVNISAGKNIVGAFHRPALVVSDTRFLETLPPAEIKNGLAEAVKHSFIGDTGSLDIFSSNDARSIMSAEVLEEIVRHSANFKAGIVSQDETESGLRAVLNFGHTFGHAIESYLHYRGISHGEAVALGMKAEIEASLRMGYLPENDYREALDLLNRYGLAPGKTSLPGNAIVSHMKFDKKNVGGTIRCVLLESLGKPIYNITVDESMMERIIEEVL